MPPPELFYMTSKIIVVINTTETDNYQSSLDFGTKLNAGQKINFAVRIKTIARARDTGGGDRLLGSRQDPPSCRMCDMTAGRGTGITLSEV